MGPSQPMTANPGQMDALGWAVSNATNGGLMVILDLLELTPWARTLGPNAKF